MAAATTFQYVTLVAVVNTLSHSHTLTHTQRSLPQKIKQHLNDEI